MEIDGQYFLAASPGLPDNELDKHINCTRDRCRYIMDETLYVTKHAPSPWHSSNCKPAVWGGHFDTEKNIWGDHTDTEQNIKHGRLSGPLGRLGSHFGAQQKLEKAKGWVDSVWHKSNKNSDAVDNSDGWSNSNGWEEYDNGRKAPKGTDWVDSVCKIIQADAIPLVLWSASQKKLLTVEFHRDGILRPDFVAISHVWSDGKGNPNENSLPECQLARIQDMVAKVRYEGRNSDEVGFWMDTMCIPVANEHKALRKKAIADMRYVYNNAKCVLILDEWLMQIPSTAETPVILTRMFQSNWIKRLWAHQEGFFPKELWVQFSDRSVNLEDLGDRDSKYTTNMDNKGVYLKFITVTSVRLVQQYGLFKHSYIDLSKQKDNTWMLYKPLLHIMQVRQTSRQADECICLATILNLDVNSFLDIPDKPDAEAAKQRMVLLLRTINKFETGIIFNNWERLEIPGFGWAPKSLLGHRGGLHGSEIGIYNDEYSEIQLNSDESWAGLPVTFPGFSSFSFSEVTRKSISCADRAFAIQAGPGISGEHPSAGSWPLYIVEVSPNEVDWIYDSQYYIILSDFPKTESDEGVLAVIGDAVTGGEDVNVFRHRCLARVRTLRCDEDTEWIDTVTTNVLPSGTKWLVM